jgi:hypothetical protein
MKLFIFTHERELGATSDESWTCLVAAPTWRRGVELVGCNHRRCESREIGTAHQGVVEGVIFIVQTHTTFDSMHPLEGLGASRKRSK